MKNILLICGGGGSEHDISLTSADFIASKINSHLYNVIKVIIDKEGQWLWDEERCELNSQRELHLPLSEQKSVKKIHYAIPCLHGFPGESGDIQSFFELIKLPYFGCSPEANTLSFNKLSTKLWLENANIPTTPFLHISTIDNEMEQAIQFLKEHKSVFVKATNQGSSVGCYFCQTPEDLINKIKEAFIFSPFIILEKAVNARELEVAIFEYEQKLHISLPGEIICPGSFYTFEEKYSQESKTETQIEALNITEKHQIKMKDFARQAFKLLKLKDLSRIDFFLTQDDNIYVNEINTFPGHTPISMFPSMMESKGVKYSDFINYHIENSALA